MTTTAVLPDALRDALGQVISDQRREWRRERELIEAQSRETISQLRADIVELRTALRDEVVARLAAVRDGKDGGEGPPGLPGEAGPPGERGLDANPQEIAALLAPEVERLVAAMPKPQDGRDGKDADPAEIAERLIPEVERAVAAIPAPRDGKDADPAEVAGLVASEVGRAVGGLPVPKDGRDGVDGKDAVIPDAPDDVAYQVTRALAILEEPTILFPPVASLVNERPKLRSVVKQKGGKLVLQYEGED